MSRGLFARFVLRVRMRSYRRRVEAWVSRFDSATVGELRRWRDTGRWPPRMTVTGPSRSNTWPPGAGGRQSHEKE